MSNTNLTGTVHHKFDVNDIINNISKDKKDNKKKSKLSSDDNNKKTPPNKTYTNYQNSGYKVSYGENMSSLKSSYDKQNKEATRVKVPKNIGLSKKKDVNKPNKNNIFDSITDYQNKIRNMFYNDANIKNITYNKNITGNKYITDNNDYTCIKINKKDNNLYIDKENYEFVLKNLFDKKKQSNIKNYEYKNIFSKKIKTEKPVSNPKTEKPVSNIKTEKPKLVIKNSKSMTGGIPNDYYVLDMIAAKIQPGNYAVFREFIDVLIHEFERIYLYIVPQNPEYSICSVEYHICSQVILRQGFITKNHFFNGLAVSMNDNGQILISQDVVQQGEHYVRDLIYTSENLNYNNQDFLNLIKITNLDYLFLNDNLNQDIKATYIKYFKYAIIMYICNVIYFSDENPNLDHKFYKAMYMYKLVTLIRIQCIDFYSELIYDLKTNSLYDCYTPEYDGVIGKLKLNIDGIDMIDVTVDNLKMIASLMSGHIEVGIHNAYANLCMRYDDRLVREFLGVQLFHCDNTLFMSLMRKYDFFIVDNTRDAMDDIPYYVKHLAYMFKFMNSLLNTLTNDEGADKTILFNHIIYVYDYMNSGLIQHAFTNIRQIENYLYFNTSFNVATNFCRNTINQIYYKKQDSVIIPLLYNLLNIDSSVEIMEQDFMNQMLIENGLSFIKSYSLYLFTGLKKHIINMKKLFGNSGVNLNIEINFFKYFERIIKNMNNHIMPTLLNKLGNLDNYQDGDQHRYHNRVFGLISIFEYININLTKFYINETKQNILLFQNINTDNNEIFIMNLNKIEKISHKIENLNDNHKYISNIIYYKALFTHNYDHNINEPTIASYIVKKAFKNGNNKKYLLKDIMDIVFRSLFKYIIKKYVKIDYTLYRFLSNDTFNNVLVLLNYQFDSVVKSSLYFYGGEPVVYPDGHEYPNSLISYIRDMTIIDKILDFIMQHDKNSIYNIINNMLIIIHTTYFYDALSVNKMYMYFILIYKLKPIIFYLINLKHSNFENCENDELYINYSKNALLIEKLAKYNKAVYDDETIMTDISDMQVRIRETIRYIAQNNLPDTQINDIIQERLFNLDNILEHLHELKEEHENNHDHVIDGVLDPNITTVAYFSQYYGHIMSLMLQDIFEHKYDLLHVYQKLIYYPTEYIQDNLFTKYLIDVKTSFNWIVNNLVSPFKNIPEIIDIFIQPTIPATIPERNDYFEKYIVNIKPISNVQNVAGQNYTRQLQLLQETNENMRARLNAIADNIQTLYQQQQLQQQQLQQPQLQPQLQLSSNNQYLNQSDIILIADQVQQIFKNPNQQVANQQITYDKNIEYLRDQTIYLQSQIKILQDQIQNVNSNSIFDKSNNTVDNTATNISDDVKNILEKIYNTIYHLSNEIIRNKKNINMMQQVIQMLSLRSTTQKRHKLSLM